MALIDDGQLTALAEDIVPPAPGGATAEQIAARNSSVASVKDLCTKLCQYIVDQMEIEGVKTTLNSGSRTIETYVAGVGTNTGSLASATGGPVAGSVKDSKTDAATQSNDGKGLVK